MAERVVRVKLLAQVSDYEKGMLEAARATRTVGTEAEKLAQKRQAFEQVGQGLVVTGAALTAVTALSVKAALDWESAWAGVTKTVDGSEEQMAELEQGLRGLAQTLPATHQEIAAVAEAAGQLGVAREDVVDFTKTMIDLSETTNLSADEAATSIAQLMNVMQTAPEDVDNLGAALVALGNDGASTERDIIQMAQRIAGAGRVVGLTEAQVLGFANALASVGIEAEAGGSAISRIMTDIAMSVSQGGEKLDKFAEVAGMSSADFQKAFKEAPAEAIATFIEGLGRVNDAGGDVFQTLSDLGQTDIRVSQALLGMANSGDLLRKSLELGSQAWDENTALAVEAAKRYETTESKIQVAGNAIRDAAIDFGQVFLPAVGAAADGVAQFAQFMGGLPDPVQGVLGVLGATVGALALAGGTALMAVPKIAEFKAAFETLQWSMKGFALVGGGVVLALTTLVTVVGSVAAAQAQAQQKAEAYADTLAEGTNKVTKATREMAQEALQANSKLFGMFDTGGDSAYDAAEKLGISLGTVTDAATGNAEALRELLKAQQDIENMDATSMQKKYGNDYVLAEARIRQVVDAVKGENASLEDAIRLAEQKAQGDQESADSSQTVAEAYMDEADAVGELTDQLSALIDQINEANGIAQDAVTANANYQAALAGISAEVQRQKDAYEEANGSLNGFNLSLDENTASGSANASMLSEVAAKAQDAAAAQFEQDKATMSSKDASDKYYSTLQSQRQAFIDSAVAAGYNATEVQALADRVFALPTEKQMKVVAETDTAAEKLRVLKEKLDAIPNNTYKRVTLESFTVGTKDVSIPGNANGGLYENGVKAFAGGGVEPGIYPYTAGGIHKFAEEFSEAYISMDPRRRERSYGVWQEVGDRFGFQQQAASAPVQVSLAGAQLTLLVDGNPVRAVVQEQLVAYDGARSQVTRRGVRSV